MASLDAVLRSMTFHFFASGQHKISPAEFVAATDVVLLDVRSDVEFDTVHFPLRGHETPIHVPLDELPSGLAGVSVDTPLAVFCSSGVRSAIAYAYLRASGFDNVRILEGGYEELIRELKPGKLLALDSRDPAVACGRRR